MKISQYTVRLKPKAARIISDCISLGLCAFMFVDTALFVERYPELKNMLFRGDLIKLWAFPALGVVPFVVYLVLIFSNHRFEKYRITEDNAQSVYDWYVFAASLCKLPILVMLADVMTIFQSRFAGAGTSWFSIGYIFYALVFVIIIRLSVHRIRRLTARENKAEKSDSIKVKAKIADDQDNSNNTV
ncbi:MAG: hypothetical protein ACI4JY_11880 [Oscillospiraceae bacterium]